jgi:hypothetical protein
MSLLSSFAGSRTIPIEIFLVGGGGGGANYTTGRGGSGGGAGMVIYKRMDARVGANYNIFIGAAGAGGSGGAGAPPGVLVSGSSGGNTSFGSLTAYGGSGGDIIFGAGNVPSLMNFGSVGGGTGPTKVDKFSTTYVYSGPIGPNGYVNAVIGKSDFHKDSSHSFDADGGFVGVNGWNYSYTGPVAYEFGHTSSSGTFSNADVPFGTYPSGGGGAGSAGQPNLGSSAPFGGSGAGGSDGSGAGGYGVYGSFIGLTTSYAGGGGAGNNNNNATVGSYPGGLGKDGGGPGSVGVNPGTPAPSGAANRGGGGGGGAIIFNTGQSGGGGAGGSGFVFIRYPTAYPGASVTANAIVTPQAGYYVYGWTSGPGTIVFN